MMGERREPGEVGLIMPSTKISITTECTLVSARISLRE